MFENLIELVLLCLVIAIATMFASALVWFVVDVVLKSGVTPSAYVSVAIVLHGIMTLMAANKE